MAAPSRPSEILIFWIFLAATLTYGDSGFGPKALEKPPWLAELQQHKVEQDACPAVSEVKNITWARNKEGRGVTVLQQASTKTNQWFATVYCDPSCEGSPCAGVDIRESRCETRFSLMPAVTVKEGGKLDWELVNIPSQCVCVLRKPRQHRAGPVSAARARYLRFSPYRSYFN